MPTDLQQGLSDGGLSLFVGQTATGRVRRELSILEARVIRAFPTLQLYEVSAAGSRFFATSGGTSTGHGVSNPVAYGAGSPVIVAVDPSSPSTGHAFILGGVATAVGHGWESGRRKLTDKIVSGTSLLRLATETHYGRVSFPSFGGGSIQGMVDGDWLVLTESGSGGIGVEYGRVWIGGGPMNGLFFYPDSQTTKITGLNLQYMTAAQEDLDRVFGNQTELVRRRCWTLREAEEEREPRELEVAGLVHHGRQRFLAVPDKGEFDRPGSGKLRLHGDDNDDERLSGDEVQSKLLGPERDGKGGLIDENDRARPALFHEFIGADGSWVLSSASSVTLQKYVGIPVPTEILEESPERDPDDEEDEDEDPPLYPEAEDEDLALRGYRGGHCGKRYRQRDASVVVGDPLDSVVLAVQQIEARVNYLARQGFDLLDKEWVTKPLRRGLTEPEEGDDPDERPSLQHGWRFGRWRCMPRVLSMPISSGKSKNFYIGRSVITITDDGSIVLQDAYNASITMSKGDIILQAPGNIVGIAGNDAYLLGGNQAGIQGRNHVEVISAEGGSTIRSRQPLAVSSDGMALAPSGDSNDFAISVGGRITLSGSDMRFVSAGGAHFSLGNPLSWEVGRGSASSTGFIGSTFVINWRESEVAMSIGPEYSYLPSLSTGRITSGSIRRQAVTDGDRPAREMSERYSDFIRSSAATQPLSEEEVQQLQQSRGRGSSSVEVPEPSWATFLRVSLELDEDFVDDDDRDVSPSIFPVGLPASWRVKRLVIDDRAGGGASPTGFINYLTGGYYKGAEEYPEIETVGLRDGWFGLYQHGAGLEDDE